jgi:hypothetical protein
MSAFRACTILLFASSLLLAVNCRKGKRKFADYIAPLMTDDAWREFLWTVDNQHHRCHPSGDAVHIRFEEYFGNLKEMVKDYMIIMVEHSYVYAKGKFIIFS